jgi:hypothetical protein
MKVYKSSYDETYRFEGLLNRCKQHAYATIELKKKKAVETGSLGSKEDCIPIAQEIIDEAFQEYKSEFLQQVQEQKWTHITNKWIQSAIESTRREFIQNQRPLLLEDLQSRIVIRERSCFEYLLAAFDQVIGKFNN